MLFRTFLLFLLFLLLKHMFYLIKNIKRKNIKKESKFYVINFIDPRIFLKKENITPCAMKSHIQKSYKVSKVAKWKEMTRDVCEMDPNKFLTDARVNMFFLKVVLC